MKKVNKLVLTGAIAILAVAACNKPEPVTDNPTYNPETKEVTAQFVMNISTNNANAETKMLDVDVQANGNFRGMDQVHILTYSLDYTGGNNDYFLYKNNTGTWPTSSFATRDYDLSKVLVAGEITADASSKVMEMSLPLATNAVLIYGIAPKTKSNDEQGSVILSGDPVGKSVANINYTLGSRMTSLQGFNQFTDLIGRIFTGILRAGLRQEVEGQASMDNDDNRYKFWWPIDEVSKKLPLKNANDQYYADGTLDQTGTYTFHIGSQSWRDYALAYDRYLANPSDPNNKMSALEIRLGDMYKTITTIQTNGMDDDDPDFQIELRAGSAQAIFRLSEDVYSMLTQMEQANISTWHDYIAMLVATDIHSRAYQFFYEDPVTKKMTWRPLTGGGSIQAAVDDHLPDRTWSVNYSAITDDYFNRGANQPGFPLNLGLPAGAALMTFVTVPPQTIPENQYETVRYLNMIPAYGMGGASVSVENYRYPAELMYWTNSSLHVTDNTVSKESYPVTVATWDRTSSWATWTMKGSVKSTTRGVAVAKEINYGTALLKTQVKYGANTIYDNNQGIHPSEDNNAVDVQNTANQFKVTGLIIGGVDDKVGWDFLPYDNHFDHLVYDRLSNQEFYIPTAKATSDAVYTMTWDNYNSSEPANAQLPVYIALELVNNTGKDLWGGLNLIRSGGTFYLVGKLDPTSSAALDRMKTKLGTDDAGNVNLSRTNFNYPPYDSDGNTINAVRVFMQDFVTEVTFTFNAHSLRNAYVTMPDLRASNVSLGLSVDLDWEKGLYYEDVPLGGISD